MGIAPQAGMNDLTEKQLKEKIHVIRGRRVMLDSDLAEIYGVETFNLIKAMKRNRVRFPDDFMFQLTEREAQSLTFQIGISNHTRGGRRTQPYVFTQEGVAMLSGILRSERAVQANIAIMRTFVRLRELMESHRDLASKLQELEKRYDHQFSTVFNAIRELMKVGSPITPKRIRPPGE